MDGGIDDALALVLALKSRELEVAGITAVSGNVSVEQATTNALRVVELVDRPEVWVSKGLARPLSRDPIRAFAFHGKDGLGDSNLPHPKLQPSIEPALKMINETLTSAKKSELNIICTGPITNVATLLAESPDSSSMIGEIVIMGGAYGITKYGMGNETPAAEFNIYSDPDAAKFVFEAGVQVKAVGLDVTTIPELELSKTDYVSIRKTKNKFGAFATRILENNFRARGSFTLHDPMAVAVVVRPGFYKFSRYHVQVETRGEYTTGMTIADRRGWIPENRQEGKSAMICTEVDPRFKQLFLDRLIA